MGSAHRHADGVIEAVYGRQLHGLMKISFACFTEEPTDCSVQRIHIQAVGDVQPRGRSS